MARFWVGGGSSTQWAATAPTNWAASSGGAGNQTVPDITQDVTFDGAGATGNSASVIAASISCLSLTFTSGYTQSCTINTTRVLTVGGNFTDHVNHTWVVSGTGAMTISAASTITSGGKTFPGPVTLSGVNTKTLSGDWTITGALTSVSGGVINTATLNCAGLTITNATSGTTVLNLTGGTWTTAAALQNSLSFASGAVITVSGAISYNTGIMTNNGATVTTTGSTLTVALATTFNTSGISWNNITISGASTQTINSVLTATGTLTINASLAVTFAGTAGFTVGTFICSHSVAATITFANTVTYTITTAFNAFSTRTGSILLFTSDHASNKAILTLNNGATCNVLASFTRIDASLGRAIWTFNGTLTTCFNIFSLTDLSFVVGKSQVIQGFSNF